MFLWYDGVRLEVNRVELLDQYIVALLTAFKRPRKTPFLYAVMTGRRTGQAVTDVYLAKINSLFGLSPFLTEEILTARLKKLRHAGILDIEAETKEWSVQKSVVTPFFELEGWNGFWLQERPLLFFQNLLLAIQVVSNKHHKKKHYMPVVRDKKAQFWIKKWLVNFSKAADLNERLFLELEAWLSKPYISKPEFYTDQFSGGEIVGETLEQIADAHSLLTEDVYFESLYGLHRLFLEKDDYPLLRLLMPRREALLTLSGKKTYGFLKKGYDFDEIVQMRNLRTSTIEDHFVEIKATFPSQAVPRMPEEMIVDEIQARDFLSLKEIKTAFPELDYYQIRLAVVAGGKA